MSRAIRHPGLVYVVRRRHVPTRMTCVSSGTMSWDGDTRRQTPRSSAFRRTIQSDEIERLLKLYDAGEKMEGGDFEKAMKLPVRGLLISPFFLLRIEAEGFADTYPLTPFELASRLSYFLWSSMPDDELLELAKTGKILNQKELEAQTNRMLKDPKAFALADNFTPQWLQIRRLEEMKFDSGRFPSADTQMRKDMIQETVLFFEAVMKEDLSVLTFLDGPALKRFLQRLYAPPGGAGRRYWWRQAAATRSEAGRRPETAPGPVAPSEAVPAESPQGG
jgi:hypothetical protein